MATVSATGDCGYQPDARAQTLAYRNRNELKGTAMSSASLSVQPAACKETVTPDTGSTAPTTPGQRASNAAALSPCHTAVARSRRSHLRHAITSLRQVFTTRHYGSKFHRPEVIEDDYYRFRNQPRGY
jgi:hypothetical protein